MSATQSDVRAARVPAGAAVYVYGVARAASPTPPKRGVGGTSVQAVVHRDLAALVSTVKELPIRARRRDLIAHSDVLAAAVANGAAVLPLRFGAVFERGETVVSEFLEPRYQELVGLLDQFENLVELRVKASYRNESVLEEIVRTNPRIARLRELTRGRPDVATHHLRLELGTAVAGELNERRRHDAGAIVDRLRGLADAVEVEDPATDDQVLRASFLVQRRRVRDFDAQMDDLARALEGRMQFKYLGPLAPHSFVALSAGRR
jgi:hypothetical protein